MVVTTLFNGAQTVLSYLRKMKLQDFRNIHKGETILCIGTGASLLNIPVDFLNSMSSIGINYLPYYSELIGGFMPTYWIALDSTPPKVMLSRLPPEMPRFIPNRMEKRLLADNQDLTNAVLFEIAAMPRPDRAGYSTTMAAAIQLALYMGASDVLVAGFDCTRGHKSGALPEPGKTGTPHFYDPDQGRQYMPGWDKNIQQFAEWAEDMGRNVWNISKPTQAKLVPQSDYWEWVDEE